MRLTTLFTILSLLFAATLQAEASTQNARYTADVNIDVTSSSASAARDKGMKQAYRSAFTAIAGKMTSGEGLNRLKELTDEQLINFIQETEVVSEKSSDVRYMAHLKIRINEKLLKQYMEEQSIPYVLKTAANIIVIPLFREFPADSPLLWEKNNLWRKAWENSPVTGSDNNYISIPGDGINYSILDAEKARQLNGQALDMVASHLGTRNIFVLDSYYNGIEGLNIIVMSYKDGTQKTITVNGERGPELFTQAIPEITRYIDSTIAEQKMNMDSTPSEITVLYNYPKLSNWVATEQKLQNLPQINNIKVEAMGQGKVQFKINFIGSVYDLITALKAYQINLNDMSGYYTLTTFGA